MNGSLQQLQPLISMPHFSSKIDRLKVSVTLNPPSCKGSPQVTDHTGAPRVPYEISWPRYFNAALLGINFLVIVDTLFVLLGIFNTFIWVLFWSTKARLPATLRQVCWAAVPMKPYPSESWSSPHRNQTPLSLSSKGFL